jgi:hypothetical protein
VERRCLEHRNNRSIHKTHVRYPNMAPSIPDRVHRLLNAFDQASNKRVLHPEDWGRFFELTLMVYTHALPITGWMIRNRLLAFGFPSERADHPERRI